MKQNCIWNWCVGFGFGFFLGGGVYLVIFFLVVELLFSWLGVFYVHAGNFCKKKFPF